MGSQLFRSLKIAVALAAIGSFVFTSIGAAQTSSSSGPFVVRIQTPPSGVRASRNVTFTGAAVDCGSGSPATKVAVYDGQDQSGAYLGDATMDTIRSLQRYCTNQAGSAQVGFSYNADVRNLTDGPHTIAFVATFPGASGVTTVTTDVLVDNRNVRADLGYGYGPGYYGGYYGGGYGSGPYGGGYYGGGYGSGPYGGGYGNCAFGFAGECSSAYYGTPYYGGSLYAGSFYNGSYGCTPVNYSLSCGPGGYGYGGYGYGGGYPYYGNIYNPNYGSGSCGGFNYNVCSPSYGYGNYLGNYYGNYYGNCAYMYYYSYANCGNNLGYFNNYVGYGNLGYGYITLNQAGQTVRSIAGQVLSGYASCSNGTVSTVSVYDRTSNANTLIGTSAGPTYGVTWTPGTPLGGRTIQVVANGTCGSFSQTFSVTVIA